MAHSSGSHELAAPQTPSRQALENTRLDTFIETLSATHNLGLRIPDIITQSPSKLGLLRKNAAETDRSYDIYHRIRVLWFKDQPTFHRVVADFKETATEICRRWVKKPRGDPDTLP